jgi:hypothetical protein
MFDVLSKHPPTDTVKRVRGRAGDAGNYLSGGLIITLEFDHQNPLRDGAGARSRIVPDRRAIHRRPALLEIGDRGSIMTSSQLARRIALTAGGAAIVGMVSLTAACGGGEEAPETTTTTTTTTTTEAPTGSPTEKAPRLDPNGPNPFSPSVIAPPAPTAIPGDH